ncbi:MAG: thiolase family protein [Acidimicrobiia bacterium]|nr:thiolase family protein [Acidimicrobiia bacterium]MDQ3500756.1 thiolase family protein [Actinomycetota bacterium]
MVYVVSAVRSAIGRFGGAFKDLTPPELAAPVMKAALERAGIGGDKLDLVIMGNVLRGGHGQLVPRQAAFLAGIPKQVNALAVDMVCSSGMAAVITAAAQINAGEVDVILAGGFESMSGAGFGLDAAARWGYKYSPAGARIVDLMARDGLSDPESGEAMGQQTEQLIEEEGVTRRELDEIAALSNQRAAAATGSGEFADEIVPVPFRDRKEEKQLTVDEGFRADTTIDSLSALRPAFKTDGRLTAANSSQISDGAAALVLASENAVKEHRLTPIARITGSSWAAGEPYRFPEAPIPAVEKLLKRQGKSINDFDLFENNEAFALNSILFTRRLGVDIEQLNVNGGAIALGHPIGASGARILVTLIHALQNRGGSLGLAAICHGTGGGTVTSLELV